MTTTTKTESYFDKMVRESNEKRAAHELEIAKLNERLAAAMSRAGVDGELVIAAWHEQQAWADASGYSVTGATDELAERGARWLKKALEAMGRRGGFSNVWGASAPRGIELGRVRDGVATVQTHYHMIGD